jgi:hypothetical protein
MVAIHFTPASLGSRSVKKGRHRRFEEARKLKQSGPDFLFSNDSGRLDTSDSEPDEDDDYAALARKYGAFDDDDKSADDD